MAGSVAILAGDKRVSWREDSCNFIHRASSLYNYAVFVTLFVLFQALYFIVVSLHIIYTFFLSLGSQLLFVSQSLTLRGCFFIANSVSSVMSAIVSFLGPVMAGWERDYSRLCMSLCVVSIRCWRLSLREAEGCHCASSRALYESGPSAPHSRGGDSLPRRRWSDTDSCCRTRGDTCCSNLHIERSITHILNMGNCFKWPKIK